jgi:hypothetical protein
VSVLSPEAPLAVDSDAVKRVRQSEGQGAGLVKVSARVCGFIGATSWRDAQAVLPRATTSPQQRVQTAANVAHV